MIFDDMKRLKDEGMQAASVAWGVLSTDPNLTAISIFKAACATKTSEMITRLTLTDSKHHAGMMKIIEQFFEDAIIVGGQAGIDDRLAKTAADQMDELLPITAETYANNEMFARRMHTMDGIALEAAKSFGKEEEFKSAVKRMQQSFMKLILGDITNILDMDITVKDETN